MYKIRRYYFTLSNDHKYSLKLSYNGRKVDGKYQVNFLFKRCNTYNNNVLFWGSDFYPSPLCNNPIGIKSAMHLLSFLTLRDGDTDADYFKYYSPSQKDFINSLDCEELQMVIYDYENKERI